MFSFFKKKCSEEVLADFFKSTDIVNIQNNKLDPSFHKEEVTEGGTNLTTDAILWDIEDYEFGVFYSAFFRQFSDTYYNISFNALPSVAFPKEIVKVVKYLTKKYGPDSSGKGEVSLKEIEQVLAGRSWVGRFWPDHAMVNYSIEGEREWSLSLFGNQKGK